MAIFEEELRRFGNVVVCTDDGSYGRKGFVTEAAREALVAGGVDIVYAVGPVPMMRAIANLTFPFGVKNHRISQSRHDRRHGDVRWLPGDRRRPNGFACVDGPEFDGHDVNYEELLDRLSTYREFEQKSTACAEGHCRGGKENQAAE